jgi:hypothetical protein
MTIELNDKDHKDLEQLRNCLASGNINIEKIRSFLERLEQKVKTGPAPSASGKKTRIKKKEQRKAMYRKMIQENIHGNTKMVI